MDSARSNNLEPGKNHVTCEDYLAVLRGEARPGDFQWQVRHHLLAVCEACRDGCCPWAARVEERSSAESEGLASIPVRGIPDDPREVSPADVDAGLHLLSAVREAARLADQDLVRLLRLPRRAWRATVERARSRLQSRAFAERLIAAARERVAIAPGEAAELCALVIPALDRGQGRWRAPWAQTLAARADAHRANALRVAGDLRGAAEIFANLHRQLRLEPLADPAASAEILSLEASLAIGQRNLRYASVLLRRAQDRQRAAGDPVARARTLVKHASLLRTLSRPVEMLPLLDQAAELFDPSAEPALHRSVVHARLNAYLDLGHGDRAAEFFRRQEAVYRGAPDDPYLTAMHESTKARIALALGRHEEAIAAFRDTRDRLFRLGREYDAILASLYLADAYLAAGEFQRVRSLADDLVPLFESKGVTREMLASLRLLTHATQAEAALSAAVADLRDRLGEQRGRFVQRSGE